MKQNKKPKTKITICITFEAFDKLEQLSEELGISRSQLIEKCILTIYNALKEKEARTEEQTTTPEEAIAEAR
jgi:biotin operon repressor